METKTIDNNQLWDFINTYFHDHPQHLVQHHIDSYNYFFETDLFRIFKENNPQTLHSDQYDETHQDYSHSLKMYFGGKNGDKIYFGKPVISDKGNPHIMMPNEARLRDMNYSMPVHYDIEIEYTRYVTPEEAQQIEQRQKVIGGGQEYHTPLLPLDSSTIQLGGGEQMSQEQRDTLKEKLLHNVQFQNNIHEYLLQGGSFQRNKVDEKEFQQGGAGNKQKQPQTQTQQSRTIAHISTFRLEQIYLGSFPIMVQSKFCILNGMTKEMRFSMGECLSDVGGYFIISGKEKAIIPQEKFGNNMLRVQVPTDDKYDWSADILSVSENISKPIRGLSIRKHAQTGQIVVLLPNVRSPVPLFIVFRALGVISDRDIIEMCLLDMEQYKGFVQDFRPSIHDAGSIFTQRDALQYIALLTKWKQLHTAQLILADYFLPHIGETNFLQKAYYLGYMVLKLLRAKNGLDQPTDRDHFKYKRLELVGTLISDLFREYYTVQLHKIHTAFESQMYFKRGQYAAHLDNLIADTHKPIFQNIRDVQQGFKKAFKGNWGGQPHTKRIGVVQDLNRLSSNSALDHLRKTNLPIDPSMVKVVALRVLHASQWGLFDPIDTPDGGNIGLHKHLSIMTHVTRQVSREPMIHWMRQNLSQFYLLSDLRPTVAAKMSKVFVNGYWLGATTDPIQNMKKMLLHRRNGLLPIYTSISFDYRENILYIHTEGGRVCRPIFYWDDDSKAFSSSSIPALFEKHSSNHSQTSSIPPSTEMEIKTQQITWEKIVSGFNEKKLSNFDTEEGKIYDLGELYQLTTEEAKQKTPKRFIKHKAILEYIDNMESQYSLISLDPPYSSASTSTSTISPHTHPDRDTDDDHPHRETHLDKETKKQTPKWTHQEIHPALNHGMMCNLIIFLENNPASRNNFSCTQSKQAVSLYHTNYQTRMDKTAVILNSGQIPLMKTRFLEYINGENNPYGTNAIVAIMCYTGYNVEDATLVNEGALQRGLFKTTYHSTYSSHEENNQTKSSHFITAFAQSANVKNLVGTKPGCDYSHLDENGMIKEGTEVDDKTVIIGMITTDVTPGTTDPNPHDCSVFPKKGQVGIVDKVFITEGEEGQRIAKIRIRETRIPAMGDKLASRAGQKGTIGMIVPECNMPFTAQGIRPDIIINPHAIPTRMTIGHLVECISGKACAQMGGYGDCTAYNNDGSKIQVFGEILASFGYHSSGNEILYDGLTGQQMEASIFMGPNYYMRLKQMVKDKINYRSLGPNTALTRQPVSGRANDGGLRVGEMEKDAIYAHGISFFLQESMLDRGDHVYLAICNQTGMTAIYNPERNLIFSPMADGPVKYSGSLETGDMRLDVVSKFGRSFSVVKIPYVMKLFMQEMLACGIQMRLITEDNIQQLESMSFSHNLSLMMDETKPEDMFAKVKRIVSKHVGEKRYEPIAETRTPPQITAKNIPEMSPETYSPPYAPGSPAYIPPGSLESPQYAPYSPAVIPDSYTESTNNSSPGYNPYDYGTPSFDLSSPPEQIPQANPPQNQQQIPQQAPEQQLQVGGRMHFRGDSKPSRIWTVKNIGNQFLTIDTDDMEFISKADIPKIVTRGDLYPPSYLYQPQYQTGGFIQAQPFSSPTALMPTPYQTPNAGSGTVINIGGAKLVSGDDNSTIKTVKENASDAFGGQNDKVETKIEGGKMEAKSALDFNQNLVIRKIE
jgi:DNA-directed RNA polymerase II subunit RPB2